MREKASSQRAIRAGLDLARRHRVFRVATTAMSGGKRLSRVDGLHALVAAAEGFAGEIVVRVRTAPDVQAAIEILRTFGVR
jgi:hypothetical protein